MCNWLFCLSCGDTSYVSYNQTIWNNYCLMIGQLTPITQLTAAWVDKRCVKGLLMSSRSYSRETPLWLPVVLYINTSKVADIRFLCNWSWGSIHVFTGGDDPADSNTIDPPEVRETWDTWLGIRSTLTGGRSSDFHLTSVPHQSAAQTSNTKPSDSSSSYQLF